MFNMYEVIFLFFLYGFTGWLSEVILSVIKHHRFVNRGFLIGPILPIWGLGGFIATVFFSKYAIDTANIYEEIGNILYIFVWTTIICSILEYFTSWLMEKMFNNRWWDYTDMRFNLNGRICLLCSLGFGAGCTVTLKLANPIIRALFDTINLPINVVKGIDLLLIFILFIDIMTSFKIINNFKNISNSVVEDSTEKITAMVKKTILNNYNIFYRRLVESFPDMKIQNSLSKLRDRIYEESKKIEKATYKLDKRKIKLKELEIEFNKKTNKGLKNKITNLFKKK